MLKRINNILKRSIFPMLILISVIACLLATVILLVLNNNSETVSQETIILYVLLSITIILIFLFMIIIGRQISSGNKIVNKGINYYVENLVSELSIGIIIFQANGEILWISDFIEERFGERIINETLNYFNKDINLSKKIRDFTSIYKKDEYVYRLSFVAREMVLVVKDITQEFSATHFYEIEKPVIGEVEIDNYQLFRASFSDDEIFHIQSIIKQIFDNLSKTYNLFYRQYSDGKFLIITNRDNLNKIILTNFEAFEKLNNVIIGKARLSLSIGFGVDTSNFSQLISMAKEALYQSQTRGGDQITIISAFEKTKRFGSKSEITVVKSRTRIKNTANNLKIKLNDSKIKNVVIYGHKFADLDAIGASYALYEIAKSFGKNCVIQNATFDSTAQKALKRYLKNQETIFVSKSKIKSLNKEETIVIIVDCSEETRVENPHVFNNVKSENLFIFDHHRVSKLDDVVHSLNTYIESTASSASEIITELIQFNEFQKNISKLGAQMLLNGIFLDTNQFRKSTSSRTFAAVSLLEDWGANIDETLELMKIPFDISQKISQIVSKSKEIKPGYWLSYTDEIIPIDVISIAADEILKIEGRKASFVVGQLPKASPSDNPVYKLSARSIGVNVQLIAEAVGGGGHFNAAAAMSDSNVNETLDTFVDNIIQAIVSSKEE